MRLHLELLVGLLALCFDFQIRPLPVRSSSPRSRARGTEGASWLAVALVVRRVASSSRRVSSRRRVGGARVFKDAKCTQRRARTHTHSRAGLWKRAPEWNGRRRRLALCHVRSPGR